MQGNVWGEIYTHMYVAPDVGKCMERDIHSYVCGTRCRELYGERYTLIYGTRCREMYGERYIYSSVAGNVWESNSITPPSKLINHYILLIC